MAEGGNISGTGGLIRGADLLHDCAVSGRGYADTFKHGASKSKLAGSISVQHTVRSYDDADPHGGSEATNQRRLYSELVCWLKEISRFSRAER